MMRRDYHRKDLSRVVAWGLVGGVVFSMGGLTTQAQGQEEVEPYSPNTGAVSFASGVDFTTAYFFRGIFQEDSGFITQPWADITINLSQGVDGLDSLDLTFGLWNSLHDEQTDATGLGPDIWYESDFYIGFNFTMDRWGLGVLYTALTSPNGAFSTVQEAALVISFDDAQCWESAGFSAPGFNGLQPTITVVLELDGQSDQNDEPAGTDEGTYLEIALDPGFTLVESQDLPVRVSFPVTVGLSLDNYYESALAEDNTFGFIDLGVVLGVPLNAPAEYGQWDFNAGVHFMFLANATEAANDGDSPEFEIIGTMGFSMSY